MHMLYISLPTWRDYINFLFPPNTTPRTSNQHSKGPILAGWRWELYLPQVKCSKFCVKSTSCDPNKNGISTSGSCSLEDICISFVLSSGQGAACYTIKYENSCLTYLSNKRRGNGGSGSCHLSCWHTAKWACPGKQNAEGGGGRRYKIWPLATGNLITSGLSLIRHCIWTGLYFGLRFG